MLRKLLACVFCSGFLISTWAAPTSNNTLYDLLAGFKTLTAQFEQVVSAGNGHPAQKSYGTMAIERPDHFRWQVTQPQPQLLIADGKHLWIYDEDLRQATRQKLDTRNTNSPASLLSGSVQDLADRFNVTQTGPTYKLVPKQASDLFASVELTFSQGILTHMRLLDSLGNQTDFYFNQVQLDKKLNPGLFKFTAPRGVEIIQE
ncbi:MAG: outer membrane lipoprotein chaperone LolA [Gammaproteobacteria bacterium]